MFPASDDLLRLLARVKAGDPAAAREFHDRLTPHLFAVARKHLNAKARVLFDSIDIVQMAWQAFFNRPVESLTFEDSQHLLAYVLGVTRNQVRRVHREYLVRQATDLRRQTHLGLLGETAPDFPSPAADPQRAVDARIDLGQVIEEAEPPANLVLELLAAGCSVYRASVALGLGERTVYRLLERLQYRWKDGGGR